MTYYQIKTLVDKRLRLIRKEISPENIERQLKKANIQLIDSPIFDYNNKILGIHGTTWR